MHKLSTLGLCIVLTLYLCTLPSNALRVGAFNIQSFGPTKYADEADMGYIERILRRYDVVIVQEIKDAAGNVIPGLLDRLDNDDENWNVTYSERLGLSSTSYREQYAIYYRTEVLSLVESYQFDDGVDDGSDAFSREPFGALFNSSTTGDLKEFGILGVHIAPDEAVSEINALKDVFDDASEQWGIEDIMLMGDLNADCSYVNNEELANLILRQNESYVWLIDDDVDTTVSATDCAYDRIIISGELLKKVIDPKSAQVYRFDTAFELDSVMAKGVSDHYPVEVIIPSDEDDDNGGSPSTVNLERSEATTTTAMTTTSEWTTTETTTSMNTTATASLYCSNPCDDGSRSDKNGLVTCECIPNGNPSGECYMCEDSSECVSTEAECDEYCPYDDKCLEWLKWLDNAGSSLTSSNLLFMSFVFFALFYK